MSHLDLASFALGIVVGGFLGALGIYMVAVLLVVADPWWPRR